MKDQCKQAVAQALGKQTLNAQEVAAVEKSITKTMQNLAREDRQKWQNMSLNDRISAAGQRIAQDILGEVRRKNKIAANDIIIQARNLNQLDHPSLPASQVVDRMIAPHGDMSGIQSFSSQARAIAGIYRGELMDFYTNVKGGIGVWTDKALVHDIIKERFGESSGNALAKQISDKMGEVFGGMKDRFNRGGGNIATLDNWALPQTHSAQKLIEAKKDQWVRDAENVIDREMYVKEDGSLYSDAEIKALLEYSYDSITSNGANKLEIGRNNFGGNSKVTSKHSESRVLHFKNADAWLEYQEKYGGMQFVDLVEAHINGLSKDIALVENLGSNPKGAMRILMDAARKKDWEKGVDLNDTKKGLNRSQVMFDEFMGANMPENEVLANIGLTYRSTNVASMLGGTTLASLTDQAMILKTAQIHDISYRKIFGEVIGQLNPKNKADREQAHSLGLATEEMIGSIARWSDDGLTSVHGKAEKAAKLSSSLATQILRLSGLNALTAANKVGFSKMLMDKYGRLTREKSWNDLEPIDRELLQGTGLNERTWEIMRLAEPVLDRKGNQLMSARSIYQIPDDKILAAMDGDVRKLVDDINNQVNELNIRNTEDDLRVSNRSQRLDDTKRQLKREQVSDRLTKSIDGEKKELAKKLRDEAASRFQAHLLDEQGMAVIEAGLREKTWMTGGLRKGTAMGEILRSMLQFKSFPAAMLMRHGSRTFSRPTTMSKATYGASLVALTSLLGAFVVQLREIVNGNDPLTMWDSDDPEKTVDFMKRSIAQGGGLAIMGDIVVAGMDPTGRSTENVLTGPFGSDVKTALNVTLGNATQLANGIETNAGNEAFKAIKGKIPGQNLWYTKAVMNRMIFDELQDTIAPGYREKVLRKAERQHDKTRFWGDDLSDIQMPDFERVVQ